MSGAFRRRIGYLTIKIYTESRGRDIPAECRFLDSPPSFSKTNIICRPWAVFRPIAEPDISIYC